LWKFLHNPTSGFVQPEPASLEELKRKAWTSRRWATSLTNAYSVESRLSTLLFSSREGALKHKKRARNLF
jgi:hypothetical protein